MWIRCADVDNFCGGGRAVGMIARREPIERRFTMIGTLAAKSLLSIDLVTTVQTKISVICTL